MPKRRKKYPLPRRILRFLKRQFRNPRKRLLAELAAVVVIIGIVIFIALSGQNIATDDIKDGRAYIEGLEATDTASVEEQVKELRKEERKAALESGDMDVWSQFTDIAILAGELPQRGDVIIFKYPKDPDVDFIKRIIGIPGDVIEVRNKQVYRNGEALKEDYVRIDEPDRIIPGRDIFGPVTVPEGMYFVMGDNRDNSMDSRFWGFVPKNDIIAKARRIYWSWQGLTDIRWSRLGQAIN